MSFLINCRWKICSVSDKNEQKKDDLLLERVVLFKNDRFTLTEYDIKFGIIQTICSARRTTLPACGPVRLACSVFARYVF
jgi:hypothetical protein